MWLLPQGRTIIIFCFILMINGQQISMETESSTGKMTFTPPTLSDEDKHLIHMPNYLQCDGCKAVSYSLHKAFEDRHKQRKDQGWKMKQGDVLEIFEKVCTYGGVGSNYGISEEGGVKRLKGPGVYEATGAAQMGGRLPFRLAEMCETYREADEWQIYKKWLGKGRIQAGIEDFLCFNDLDKGEDGDLDLNFCGRAGKKEGLEDYSGSSSYSSSLEDELEENFGKEEL